MTESVATHDLQFSPHCLAADAGPLLFNSDEGLVVERNPFRYNAECVTWMENKCNGMNSVLDGSSPSLARSEVQPND